ncbi:MAG: DNA polymerase I [Syntrophobacterales bacterium]|nr:DNA polymerase I [Syntrophobacterales bacterium]
MLEPTSNKVIYLIDGSSYLYRAYYGVKANLMSPQGIPTRAIYGFAQMLHKVLKEKSPSYVCVVFDAPGKKFRHDMYPNYKRHREMMPEDLIIQVGYIKQLIDLLGIPRWEEPQYEADDLIASAVRWSKELGYRVVIVSGDKDLHQLISSPQVVQWDPQRDQWYDERTVEEKVGVPPSKIADFLAIVGDKSDDVPGVSGIGEKGALKLLKRYKNLEEILEVAYRGELSDEASLQKRLLEHREEALLSKKLVLLKDDLHNLITLEQFRRRIPDVEALRRFYKELGFRSFLKELEEHLKETQERGLESLSSGIEVDFQEPSEEKGIGRQVKIIESLEELKILMENIGQHRAVSLDLETSSENPMIAEIVGCAFSLRPYEAFYVPLKRGIELKEFIDTVRPILEDELVAKYGQNLKYEMIVLKRHGIELRGIKFDTMVASYLLDPAQRSHGLKWMAERYLGEVMKSYSDVTAVNGEDNDKEGKEPKRKKRGLLPFEAVPLKEAAEYAGADAEVIQRLTPILLSRLKEEELFDLYIRLEVPLISVLAQMEYNGVLVDIDRLRDLSKEFDIRLRNQEERIYSMVGEVFNIQSPKQLATILFEKLGLPVIKKTKTGPSTDMGVLEELALQHPVAQEILAYRTFAKLKNTYVDKLPELVNSTTGRIHTSYNQTVTVTGRLSSSNPNLQNIPIKAEEGRRIREAFIPKRGYRLISADYSQIELRILAHYSRDEGLIRAFKEGDDIHRITASEIFHVSPQYVTPEMRRQAKTINFGIIYGMGPYKLSRSLGISQSEAKEIIERYFARYSGVGHFIEKTIALAREKGFVKTLFGRKRWVPEVKSQNKNVRQQGERLAFNTVIQGTAADIMKKSMVEVHRELTSRYPEAMLILQVHDELVLEVPEEKVYEIASMVKGLMESVCSLEVPLQVDVGHGLNWAQAHN